MAVFSIAVYSRVLGYANTILWLGVLARNNCRWGAIMVA
jgi:hypothetical protein